MNTGYSVELKPSGRGNAYRDQGNLKRAISDYNEGIRLAPKWGFAYKSRGLAYLRAGERDKAYADFATMRRLQSDQ